MILKILNAENKNGWELTGRWTLISEVLNATYVIVTGEKYKSIVKNSGKDYPFDYTTLQGEPTRVALVDITRKNGTLLYVAFNTIGYLLNDEGKTIEKISS